VLNHLPYDQTRRTPNNDDHPDSRTSGNHESLFAANPFLSHDEDLDLENLNLARIVNATQSLLLTKVSVSASVSLAMENDLRRDNRRRWVVLLEIKFGRATPARIGFNTVWLARAQIFFVSGFNAL
jgi:post-segregation antitoxin (ccd killing protein)